MTLESKYPESVKAFNETISLLKKLKKTYHDKKSPFRFVHVNPIEHGSRLIRDLGISDLFPGIVAINSKRKVYRNYRGAFDEVSITSFLNDLTEGKGRNIQLKGKLNLDEVVVVEIPNKSESPLPKDEL